MSKTVKEETILKVISMGANTYIGEIVEEGSKVVIQNSICLGQVGNVTATHLAKYIKEKNVNNLLKPIAVRGQTQIADSELSEDLKLELEILERRMEQARKLAPGELENKKFDELLKG